MREDFNSYLYIYAYCFITNGKHRFSILNTMENKLHFFDMCLYQIAKKEFREKSVNGILKGLNDNDREVVEDFVGYLIQNNLARFVDDIDNFPLLQQEWDTPHHIKYSIIDMRDVWHNFDLIFSQLSDLLCPELEVRAYRNLSLADISKLSETFTKYNFDAFYLLIPYAESHFTQEGIERLSTMTKDNSRLVLNVYGVPDTILEELNIMKNKITSLEFNLRLFKRIINSHDDCGRININTLKPFDIAKVMEIKQHNGCLNRMISIDENGFIKNCPSMIKSWGNIKDTTLVSVYNLKEFQKYWNICNDMVEICSSCEYRCVCLGCRAYTENPDNLFSKPLKCIYTP